MKIKRKKMKKFKKLMKVKNEINFDFILLDWFIVRNIWEAIEEIDSK